ncbi:phytoene desaturase family protein [Phycicoccus sonneratiae]|uniref:Pyridine nucleotide-disulfide oxidoreductase domain-containing protein 2 n=1 Tax=Phycicoccus sonneratiae TaxID=2807628 RepID=A0ABS2CNV6_9MICO|nr:NAD(P)/FAD-dependent oxidoreductase [Phycicoccus sonneraticus]MBM6401568.1 NAD(P)/FAD-dependent oxidoreductase [Phycicoccus sonneraticus]
MTTCDAVVVGGGPNGLVAAAALGDAGWDVVLVEAQDEVGGAVRSAEVTAPGFVSDLFSAFYPLAAASPVIRDLDLGAHGLRWARSPDVVGHAFPDGRAAVLHASADDTAAAFEADAPGDGDAWLRMVAGWDRVRDPLLDALFTPLPAARPAARLLRRAGVSGTLDLARLALLSVRRLGAEEFDGEGPRALLSGNAMHSDVPPDGAGSALFGWLLVMLGQDVGFPVPVGGAGALASALRRRGEASGVQVRCGTPVSAVEVSGGRARGVRLADGTRIRARRAVLADVPATTLYTDLVGPSHLPPRLLADLARFDWDDSTLKLNWALDAPVPWRNPALASSGTVHLGVDDDGLVDVAADLSVGRMPERPFVLLGQMATADPTRAPEGAETAWAYTHLPRRFADDAEAVDTQVRRVEAAVEQVAPGFGSTVRARFVQRPDDLETADANLSRGALNGGTAALHQQLVMRPTRGLGRPETPLPGLFLASASAHPGGGVHGACGWNAAVAALGQQGVLGPARRALARTAWARVLREV